jgi:hypothetical protein
LRSSARSPGASLGLTWAAAPDLLFEATALAGCRCGFDEGQTTLTSAKDDLHDYLQHGREALLWKLEGVSDYDARRPLVATGTNLLGLVKR